MSCEDEIRSGEGPDPVGGAIRVPVVASQTTLECCLQLRQQGVKTVTPDARISLSRETRKLGSPSCTEIRPRQGTSSSATSFRRPWRVGPTRTEARS